MTKIAFVIATAKQYNRQLCKSKETLIATAIEFFGHFCKTKEKLCAI